jgi:hypothetical protein
MYDLLEDVRDTTPNHEGYAFYAVVCELLSFERDYRFDICKKIEQLSWIISDIYLAQIEGSLEVKRRRAIMEKDYPKPNSEGYWPAEWIAAWATTQWCALGEKPITEKTVNNWKRRLFHEDYFHTQIHQRDDMVILVDALRDNTHAAKRARRLPRKRTQFGH